MRRFRIAKITDNNKVTKAIKNVFNPNAKEFGYDLSVKEPYCQIKDKFYLIKDLNEMSEFKSTLKKSLEEKITKTINKFKINGLNIDVNKLADDEKINKLLTDEKFLEKKGIFFDKETGIYFVISNQSLPEILGSNEEDDSNPKDEKIVEDGEISDFKWVKNKNGFIGLRSPSGKLIINFKEKFNDVSIFPHRKIAILNKNEKLFMYNMYGKKLTDKEFDALYTLKKINEPDDPNLIIFRIGDYFGIINTKGKEIISENEKVENLEELEEKYNNKEELSNNKKNILDDDYNSDEDYENEESETQSIKVKDNLFKGNPKQIKQNITRILQKNGFDVIISKRRRKF